MVILDVYQSVGAVPFDVTKLGADFVVGGSVKWICGGPGAGFLYVKPELAETLKPTCTGWFAHARPFEFEAGAIEWADTSHRFNNGTPHIPALYAARSGIRIIRDVGVERIRRNSLMLTDRIIERSDNLGYELTVPRDHEHRGGTVAFDIPHTKQVTAELLERDFVVDYRPKAGIRVSPHFYSTPEECDAVVDAIAGILDDGSWQKHGEDLY
jgi:kynureninase